MATSLHWRAWGADDAPLLLLGPSLGTTTELWERQVPALAATHRVVAFDLRGHGGSPVPPGPYTLAELGNDVRSLAERLGAQRFAYAGVSLGGMIGMWLAAQVPERVSSLALLCTSAYLPPASAWRERAALVRRDGTGAVADAALTRWFTAAFRVREAVVADRFRVTLAGVPAEGYAGCCEAIAAMDLRPLLAQIQAPTLVIAGAADPATPPAHAEGIAAAVSGARLVVVDGAHLANVESAEQVNDLLRRHLDGADG